MQIGSCQQDVLDWLRVGGRVRMNPPVKWAAASAARPLWTCYADGQYIDNERVRRQNFSRAVDLLVQRGILQSDGEEVRLS